MAQALQILPTVVVGVVLAAVLDVVHVSGWHDKTTGGTHTAQRLTGRHLVMWEQAINRACITNPAFFVEHNVEGLLRGDSLARANFYQRGIEDGWMLRSEVRRIENLPAIEGIDDAQTENATPATGRPNAQPDAADQDAQAKGAAA